MLTLLAAAVAAFQPAVSVPAGDADLRCMAAYLFAVGRMTEDPAVSAEDKAGATAMVMYFFGKVRAHAPDADVKAAIRRMVEAPTYLSEQLKHDLDRCGAEYEQRGKELNAFGED